MLAIFSPCIQRDSTRSANTLGPGCAHLYGHPSIINNDNSCTCESAQTYGPRRRVDDLGREPMTACDAHPASPRARTGGGPGGYAVTGAEGPDTSVGGQADLASDFA